MVEEADRIQREINDPELPLRQLAGWFGVTKWSLLEQERRGRIRFERKLVNGVLTAVARPSRIRDLPLYRVGEAARICKVSTRTIRRWGDLGRLLLSRADGTGHWRTTPAAIARCLRRRSEDQKKPRPPKLTDVLDRLLDAKPGTKGDR